MFVDTRMMVEMALSWPSGSVGKRWKGGVLELARVPKDLEEAKGLARNTEERKQREESD